MEALQKVLKLTRDIHRVEKMGGRDSLFGLMGIFEIILGEEHAKLNETGMYRFKGMEQYGNIISLPCAFDAIKYCVEELKFTKDECESLRGWYNGREYGPDTKILALCIEWCIKDNNYFTE